MQVYCEQDTLVTQVLYEYFQTQELDSRCFELEHEFAVIATMIEQHGFHFNERAAFGLVNVLKTKRAEIHDQLQEVFHQLFKRESRIKQENVLRTKSFYLIPVRGNKPHGVYESVTLKLVSRLPKRETKRSTMRFLKSLVKNIRKLSYSVSTKCSTNALGKLLKVKKRG